MQAGKVKASNVAASTRAGLEKTKASLEEKAEKMTTRDPLRKELATERKEERITEAELEKQRARQYNAAQRNAASTGGGGDVHGGHPSEHTGYGGTTGYSSHPTGDTGYGGTTGHGGTATTTDSAGHGGDATRDTVFGTAGTPPGEAGQGGVFSTTDPGYGTRGT